MLRIALWLMLGLLSVLANAHQQRPAIVDITFSGDGQIDLSVQVNLEARMAQISPKHDDTDESPQAQEYNRLRALPLAELQPLAMAYEPTFRQGLNVQLGGQRMPLQLVAIDTEQVADLRLPRLSVLRYTGQVAGEGDFIWQYPAEFGDSVLRVSRAGDEQRVSHWLKAGDASPPLALDQALLARSTAEVALDYVVLGFEHILPKGLDHILFVLGLFLLSIKWKPLLWQVTAFTVAHTVTLALTILGYISLSPAVIEPLIALSIAYVGIENVLTRELHAWRTVIVFLFGLLHGMGFASVLNELGLPDSEWVTALITFNVGVELGQLTVILGAFLLTFALRKKPDIYRNLVVVPGSLAIAVTGLYWTWERIWG